MRPASAFGWRNPLQKTPPSSLNSHPRGLCGRCKGCLCAHGSLSSPAQGPSQQEAGEPAAACRAAHAGSLQPALKQRHSAGRPHAPSLPDRAWSGSAASRGGVLRLPQAWALQSWVGIRRGPARLRGVYSHRPCPQHQRSVRG